MLKSLTLTGQAHLTGTGNAANNVITANDGNNTLTGGAGKDSLKGGLGNDTYLISVDDVADVIIELANEGIDTVESYSSYALANHLEHLTLMGTENINGAGNSLANTITGNSGNNVLVGAAGNDTLSGGLGNDVYLFGRGSEQDTIDNTDDSSGNDMLLLSQGISVEQLWLQQSANHLLISIVSVSQQTITNDDGNTSTSVQISQSSDQLTIKDWYSSSQTQLDLLQLADGKSLLNSEVQLLVDAMAQFAPSATNTITLSKADYNTLNAKIIAAW